MRPDLQMPVKRLNLNPGPGLAQRQSSLAEPGSGVSADTPSTLPWGQQPQGNG